MYIGDTVSAENLDEAVLDRLSRNVMKKKRKKYRRTPTILVLGQAYTHSLKKFHYIEELNTNSLLELDTLVLFCYTKSFGEFSLSSPKDQYSYHFYFGKNHVDLLNNNNTCIEPRGESRWGVQKKSDYVFDYNQVDLIWK